MFIYFLAQLISSLLERELRKQMDERGMKQIQILPEERPSTNPTTAQVLRVFHARVRHILRPVPGGEALQTFSDPLTTVQRQVLELLRVPAAAYE